jgi:hypothetical protein
VETLPLLATGKRDLRSVRELAARLSTEKNTEDKGET